MSLELEPLFKPSLVVRNEIERLKAENAELQYRLECANAMVFYYQGRCLTAERALQLVKDGLE